MLNTHLQILWRSTLESLCIGRCQYPIFGELVRYCPQAHIQLNKHMEYRHPDGGLFLVNHIPGFFFILPVPPIGALSGAYRQTYLYPRLPAPVRILYNLMALALGAPSHNRADKFAGEAIVDVFTDADDLSAGTFDLLKDHGGMHKVAGEAAQVKDDNHISHTVTDKLSGKRQLFSERIVNKPALGFFKHGHDVHIMQLGVAAALVFLVVQAFAVNFLPICADSAIYDGPFTLRRGR